MTSGVSFTATGSSSQLPVVSYQFLIQEQMLISIREQTTENFLEETMVKSITTPNFPEIRGAPLLLVGANVDISTPVPKAQRHDSSGAALRNSETIVIVAFSMIPHIDLLWHMRCSGSLCNARRMNPLARTPNFYSTTVQRKS